MLTIDERKRLARRVEYALSLALSDQYDCIVRVHLQPIEEGEDA